MCVLFYNNAYILGFIIYNNRVIISRGQNMAIKKNLSPRWKRRSRRGKLSLHGYRGDIIPHLHRWRTR